MTTMLFGLFRDTKRAGDAVAALKEKGYTKEISVLAHDKKYEESELHEIKQDASEGTATGMTVGTVTGVLAGIFSGISSVIIPGVGFLVGGPLIAALGVTGGALGALSGGLVGALVDLGINEPAAELYDMEIKKGNVLLAVTTEDETMDLVRRIMSDHGAVSITAAER